MYLIPFIYFSILTLFWWKKHQQIDICVYLSGLYTISTFCAVIIITQNLLDAGGVLFDKTDLELNFIPTIVFCALHTFCLLPFSMVYNKDLRQITPNGKKNLFYFTLLLIIVGLINFYLVFDSTLEILQGDLSTIRSDHYKGIMSPAQIKGESMPSILRYLYTLNVSTLLALPIFFYYISFEKRHWIWNAMILLTSFSVPLAGIQMADRTEIILYIQMFVFCLIFFRNLIPNKVKRLMKLSLVPACFLLITYVTIVSIDRFDKREGGATESIIQYAGQGYLNFCFFWEHAKSNHIATEREFPLINHTLTHIDSSPERRSERSGQHGFYISVFPTYLGDIMLDITIWGMLIWSIFFFIVTMLIIKASHRKAFNIGEMIGIFACAVIPIFGIFYYRYFYFTYTFLLIIAATIYISSKIKFVLK